VAVLPARADLHKKTEIQRRMLITSRQRLYSLAPHARVCAWNLQIRGQRIRSEPSALNQLNNEHNDRNHEQKMDQTATNVTDQAQKPEHH